LSLLRVAAAAVAALLSIGVWAVGPASFAAPAMWRVSGGASEVYLFGTLHALSPQAAWRTPAYDAAYRKADVVWFEADLSHADTLAVTNILSQYGVDPDRALSQKLKPADLAVLKGQADIARIDHLRPWAAAMMLSMQPVLAAGAAVESGADMTVGREAAAGGKQVRAFETLEDQAKMFAGLSEPAEVAYLTGVIHERAQSHGRLKITLDPRADSLERQWLDGDLDQLGPGLVRDMDRQNPTLYEALLKTRNLAWADALSREMAAHPGVELVNVGALHMLGDDGLPALMKARGFKVERVQ